jgi:hypothetical protein
MIRRLRSVAAAILVCALPALAHAEAPVGMRAEQIAPETAADLLIGGPDAIGGVGDWYLANDIVEVIVDDPSRRYAKSNHGGTIVDAGLRDRRDEDQFARVFPLVNLDQRVFLELDAIRAAVDEVEGWARLVVTNSGRMDSVARNRGLSRWFDPLVPNAERLAHVAVETEYAVFRGEPFVHITTTFRNEGPTPAPIFGYGDVWMRGGRSGRAFVGNALDPQYSRGFHHLDFDKNNILAAGDAIAAFTHVVIPGMPQFPAISYAIFAPERSARGLRQFGVTGDHVTLVNAYVGDPDWDQMSLLRLASALRTELAPGESWSFRRRLLITGRSDTASATDVIFPMLGYADGRSGVRGRVEPADLRHVVIVNRAEDDAPVTQIATDVAGAEAGRYRAVLPPGDYRLEFRAAQRAPRSVAVTVADGRFGTVESVALARPGALRFEPAFADGGGGRVVVEGQGDTPDPAFFPELLDFQLDGRPAETGMETNELHFIGDASDPTRVPLQAGRYRLTASRGFEFSVARVEVEVPADGGEASVAPFELERVIELPGFVSADFHVHAQASDDSGMTNEARLRSFLAESVDVIVSTDHDHVGFFEPVLDRLGVRDRIRVITGVEVTSSKPSPAAPWSIGHHNAWPVRHEPHAHRQGAPPNQDTSLADLYSLLRHRYGASVIQMNHPRRSRRGKVSNGAFLTHLGDAGEGFDPTRPIDAAPNDRLLAPSADGRMRAVDFDAIELFNGSSYSRYLQVRDDWHALLRQGFRATATANSDSHGPAEPAGYPRNYLRYDADRGFDIARWNDAVLAGRSFGTSGPLIPRFVVNGGGLGDLVAASDGAVDVAFEVAAAPWVPFEEVRLLADGEVVRRYPAGEPGAGGVTRVLGEAQLRFDRDVFLTLEVGAPLDAGRITWLRARPGPYSETLAPGFLPMAFTNPIFVDVDGNGRFDAIGLPLPARPSRAPFVAGAAALALFAALWWLRRRRSA